MPLMVNGVMMLVLVCKLMIGMEERLVMVMVTLVETVEVAPVKRISGGWEIVICPGLSVED